MKKYDYWDFRKDKVFKGFYVNRIMGLSRFKNDLYVLKTTTGKTLSIWGYRDIRNGLIKLKMPYPVRIEFKGIKKLEGNKRAFNFKINVGKGLQKLNKKGKTGKKRPTGARARH